MVCKFLFSFLAFILAITVSTSGQIITTYAGNGTYGYSGDGGPATSAQLWWPIGVTTDKSGNVYIADHDNNVIRKVNTAGIISTIAGNGLLGYSGDGGPATSAKLYHPSLITLDNTGNLYFIDQNAEVIRKINPSGIITSITGNLPLGYSGDGGPLALAQFRGISGVTADNAGNLYIADASNHAIRKVNSSGIITTIAGNGTRGFSGDGGPATSAQLNAPYEVVLDNAGNIYFPDAANGRIRKINSSGIISTFAGNGIAGYSGDGGPATMASFKFPWHLAIDNSNNIYVSDALNLVVRKITPAGIITTYAGNGTGGYSGDGGPAVNAQMTDICGVAADNSGNIYIVNRTPYYVVRKVSNCITAIVAQQPSDTTICNSGNVSFTVSSANATGFRWQVNTGLNWSDLTDNGIYSGTTTNNLHITGANNTLNNYRYRCMITNACGSIASLPANLNVTSFIRPSITIQATSATICAGSNVTFTATPQNGGSFPIFQWKKNNINTGTNKMVYIDSTLNSGDIITCVLTSNSTCITTDTAESNPISITVNPVLSPSIFIAPSLNSICFGTPVTFSSATVNAGITPSYQWTKNGTNVGANSPSYTNNSFSNGDVVACVLTSNYGCVSSPASISNAVVMNVTSLVTPSIVISSTNTSICPGTPVTYTVLSENGGSNPVYQWRKNGIDVGFNSTAYVDSNIANGDVIACINFVK